jgi:hypothetical protein
VKILIYDKLQAASGVPDEILTPALSDVYTDSNTFTATWDDPVKINCIGIGYTDATEVVISGAFAPVTISIDKLPPYCNGLYIIDMGLPDEYDEVDEITVTHDGTYIGRVGAGEYRTLGTTPQKEIGFYSTTETRKTLSGQVIPGAGGYSGRRFEATVPYKIDADVYDDIELAYPEQIQRGFPFFLLLDDEQHKLPTNMLRFYANTDTPLSMLQSAVYEFLYSYKFAFYEAF